MIDNLCPREGVGGLLNGLNLHRADRDVTSLKRLREACTITGATAIASLPGGTELIRSCQLQCS